MTPFTDGKNDELRAFQKYLTDHPVLPIQSLKISPKTLCAPAVHKKSPLKTAEEAFSVDPRHVRLLLKQWRAGLRDRSFRRFWG